MVKNDRAADELLSSTAFEKALNKAMEGKVKEAEMMLNRSEVWRRWRNTVGERNKNTIGHAWCNWLFDQTSGRRRSATKWRMRY